MCNQYRILHIAQAQRDAEAHPDSRGHISYWRNNRGRIRKTGWVVTCNCRAHQYWAPTQTELCLKLMEIYDERHFWIDNVPGIVQTNIRKKLANSSTRGED